MATYSYSGSVRTVTVGRTGTYDIVAYGGQGGTQGSNGGGAGGEIAGEFVLTAGETLKIVVGGAGRTGYYGAGGGGGGSFVLAKIDGTYQPLLIGGGGGGSENIGAKGAGQQGGYGYGTGQGGAGGGTSGGGAGLKSNGGNGGDIYSGGAHGGYAGPSYDGGFGTPLTGANAIGPGGAGGFGGGGGGGRFGGGGGGGYNGGRGGGNSGGYGGSSFLASSGRLLFRNDYSIGNGLVSVTYVSPAVCFASGTAIRVARADVVVDVAIEQLHVGERVVTASGAHRPIRWIGHRTIACRNHPRPGEVHPVRIAAHAFGPDRPARDLWVSPGHAICLDIVGEVLVPAIALVNGATIAQVEVETVTYWHLELETHDILLAENMPAESYLDMGNRGFFIEGDVVAHDASPDAPRTHADFCRPFHDAGTLVEVLRQQVTARAERLGWRLDRDTPLADLHLVVDGMRLEPVTRGLMARFEVPAGACDVRLVSAASRPRDVGAGCDARRLGVCLRAITIEDGFDRRVIAIDDTRLGAGFHAMEPSGLRWTDGRARLDPALWAASEHGVYLRVDLAATALPRWIAPPAANQESVSVGSTATSYANQNQQARA